MLPNTDRARPTHRLDAQMLSDLWVFRAAASTGSITAAATFENHTSHPSAGDVLFYPGGYSETEILIAYGSCSFASKMGPLAGNHFLTIVEGKSQLKEFGRRALWEGAQDIEFSLLR